MKDYKTNFNEPRPEAFQPSISCLTRWEDDGGRVISVVVNARTSQPATATPIVAAYGTVSSMHLG